jgi:hypothetical protein
MNPLPPALSSAEKAAKVRDYASHANGSETVYRHSSSAGRMHYTQGMAFLAETCGAYWFLDLVGAHCMMPKLREHPFQVWQIVKVENRVAVVVEDGNNNELFRSTLDYTDFPRELMPFSCYLELGSVDGKTETMVLMLPEER